MQYVQLFQEARRPSTRVDGATGIVQSPGSLAQWLKRSLHVGMSALDAGWPSDAPPRGLIGKPCGGSHGVACDATCASPSPLHLTALLVPLSPCWPLDCTVGWCEGSARACPCVVLPCNVAGGAPSQVAMHSHAAFCGNGVRN